MNLIVNIGELPCEIESDSNIRSIGERLYFVDIAVYLHHSWEINVQIISVA